MYGIIIWNLNLSCMLQTDICVIDDVCYAADDVNPANPTGEYCDPTNDPNGWTPFPEGEGKLHSISRGRR